MEYLRLNHVFSIFILVGAGKNVLVRDHAHNLVGKAGHFGGLPFSFILSMQKVVS